VLDAGAGSHPYRDLFTHTQYESADFDSKYGPTYVCELTRLPVEDARFDAVVFNQVLEHVPEPVPVMRELTRVLKASGRLIYSAPLFYEEHQQPYDFYRYTQFGVRHIFGEAGLVIERLEWLEGYFGTVGYQLETLAGALQRHPKYYGGGPIGLLCSGAGLGLQGRRGGARPVVSSPRIAAQVHRKRVPEELRRARAQTWRLTLAARRVSATAHAPSQSRDAVSCAITVRHVSSGPAVPSGGR
jgi:SAM-dependent methyltransferase